MTVIKPKPKLEWVIKSFASALPDYDHVLRKFESDKKWIKFSPRLHQLTTHFKCQNYPELYQDEARIRTAFFRAVTASDEQIAPLLSEFDAASFEDQEQFLNDFIQDTIATGQDWDKHFIHLDDLDWSPEGQEKARQEWEKLTVDEQAQLIRTRQYSLMFILASFYNYFALMVHGKKMTQLVAEAMAGNDDSLLLAVHIDKTIPEHIPYFKERKKRAIQEADQDFLEKLGRRLSTPQLQGRIRHRLLYLLFAILEGMNWLDDLNHRELLDICDQLGLDNYENRIETENALTKRLIEYRKFQKTQKNY